MINQANTIFKQARQGSVAAIIQVLNEKLADSGVRTRAIFADGVLQLLCEAATVDQLEQSPLVEQIRLLLEAIAPRNIRRVNINSRIVREQQLLWLEEISRDPENQLLWSQEITLSKPSLFKQLASEWANSATALPRSDRPKSVPSKPPLRKQREQQQFWRGLTGGALASCILLLAGWVLYDQFGTGKAAFLQGNTRQPSNQSNLASRSSGVQSAVTASQAPDQVVTSDPFVNAVRIAEQTSQASLTAKSSAEWLSLAAQWQKASDLMANVPAGDKRHETARNRVITYRKNSEIALQQAKRVQAELPVESFNSEPRSQAASGLL